MPNCIVCNTPNAKQQQGAGDFTRWDCGRCGSFALSGSAERDLETELARVPLRRSLMSHAIRRMQRDNDSHLRVIRSEELPSFWREERLPSPQRQADNLILWIGDHQTTALETVSGTTSQIAATIGLAITPDGDSRAVGWLNDQLAEMRLYDFGDRGSQLSLRLTMVGWAKYEELKKTAVQSRTAFMAMKFGDELLDRVVAECFRPAVARAGFQLRLLTDEQPAGLIDDQLRAAILSARFLIADLSHGNPGAYWEAGFAEGLGLPVIYTCEAAKWEESKTHFDTNHLVTIVWRGNDLETATRQLTATIRATFRAEAKQADD